MMKDALLRTLVDGVPGLLEQFDPDSGRFVRPGYDEPHAGWGIRNQEDVYWLALMHRTRHSDSPYFADAEILDVIAAAGDGFERHSEATGGSSSQRSTDRRGGGPTCGGHVAG